MYLIYIKIILLFKPYIKFSLTHVRIIRIRTSYHIYIDMIQLENKCVMPILHSLDGQQYVQFDLIHPHTSVHHLNLE